MNIPTYLSQSCDGGTFICPTILVGHKAASAIMTSRRVGTVVREGYH